MAVITISREIYKEKISDIDRPRTLMKERDRIRAQFIHSFFEGQWEDAPSASAFDLVIDTGKIPSDMAVRWLIEAHEALKQRQVEEQSLIRAIEIDHVLTDTVSGVLGCTAIH